MNFLKILGLVIGTGSVAGAAGSGIYYSINKKTQFDGKLVFEKKNETDSKSNYVIKLLNTQQYSDEEKKFNVGKNQENEKYAKVNKIVDISYELNISKTESKLKEIFGIETTLENAKTKITSEKVAELKELFGDEIYAKLQSIS